VFPHVLRKPAQKMSCEKVAWFLVWRKQRQHFIHEDRGFFGAQRWVINDSVTSVDRRPLEGAAEPILRCGIGIGDVADIIDYVFDDRGSEWTHRRHEPEELFMAVHNVLAWEHGIRQTEPRVWFLWIERGQWKGMVAGHGGGRLAALIFRCAGHLPCVWGHFCSGGTKTD
jgi:hypothetical protein